SSEELSSYEEETSFAANSEMTKEPSLQEPNFPSPTELSMPQGGDLDFEVLDPHRISAESTTSAHHSDSATAPWQNANVEDFDRLQNDAMNEIHSTLRERTGISNVASASGAAPANEDLRRVVAEEVKRAFHGWLRDELQRQLSEVMSELDGELS
ncbi:MAG: hypothetical protein ABIR96_08490, partial [Bdellovibrionota bacterium]